MELSSLRSLWRFAVPPASVQVFPRGCICNIMMCDVCGFIFVGIWGNVADGKMPRTAQ